MNTLATDHLDAIDLENLNAEAALLTRVDRKYLVPLDVANALATEHAAAFRALEIGGLRSFGYASTYFDAHRDTRDGAGADAWQGFHAAATGRRHRFKVRTRTYLDSGEQFLEVKTRTGRGASLKQRIPLTAHIENGPLPALDASARAFVDAALDSAHYPHPVGTLHPVLSTSYRRSTLLHESGARVTVDTDLAWSGEGADAVHAAGTGLGGRHARTCFAVLETKSPAGAGAVDRWLWRAGYRPARISKYATGLALLNPHLPANRWHRTLSLLDTPPTTGALSADQTHGSVGIHH